MRNTAQIDPSGTGGNPTDPELDFNGLPPPGSGGNPNNTQTNPGTSPPPPEPPPKPPSGNVFLEQNPLPVHLDLPPNALADQGQLQFEAATVDEWRLLLQQGSASVGFGLSPGQNSVNGLGPEFTLTGLSGAIVENAGENGPFVIEMPRFGKIDGYVQIDPGHTSIWLSPRHTGTRAALIRHRAEVERDASRQAGVDINLMIV